MRTFVINIFLSVIATYMVFRYWTELRTNALSAVLVFGLSFFLLWTLSYLYNRTYFRKLPLTFNLFFYFLKEMIHANLRIAYDILTPHYYMKPTVIALPLDAETDLEITLFATLLTLTPGTLSIDVTADRKILYVHSLYVHKGDIDKLKEALKNGFERRLLQITR